MLAAARDGICSCSGPVPIWSRVDYEHSYITEAGRRAGGRDLYFITADATAIPVVAAFDFAICLTNTWGTMSDKTGVLREMRRLAPNLTRDSCRSIRKPRRRPVENGTAGWDTLCWRRPASISRRRRLSLRALLRGSPSSLVGVSTIRPLGEIAYVVTF